MKESLSFRYGQKVGEGVQKLWQWILLPIVEHLVLFLFLFWAVTFLLVMLAVASIHELFERPLSLQEISCQPDKEKDQSPN